MDLFEKKSMKNVVKYELKTINALRIFLFIILGILSLGIYWILCFWFRSLFYKIYQAEDDETLSDYVLFFRKDG